MSITDGRSCIDPWSGEAGRDAVVELLLRFDARITELEARLKADSTNSSKPPSSYGLSKRAAQPRERGVRAPGGQDGACTDSLAHFDVHDKRGADAMTDIGILPGFHGVAMHDGLASYRQFDRATHALCGAHHLRELAGVAELYEQAWAAKLADLLIEIKDRTEHARPAPLPQRVQRRFRRRYDKIVRIGRAANPPPPPTGKRGRPALGKPGSLAKRLDEHADAALRFMTDPRVPFDNNQAERDIRMIKVQQKISGGYRTFEGAQRGMDLRSYITTARRRGYSVIAALRSTSNSPERPEQSPFYA